MSWLNAHDVFKFSVEIERNGERFYRKFSKKFDEKEICELFEFLADEEVKHAEIFGKMLSDIGQNELEQIYPQDYLSYLNSYVQHQIFAEKKLEQEIEKISSPWEALDFGISRELDTILYYQEIKKYLPEIQLNLVEKILGEERKHFMKLIELKKKY